jgi:ssRNA-specific RNase YbeY (16S rRNA maturation enzyme)
MQAQQENQVMQEALAGLDDDEFDMDGLETLAGAPMGGVPSADTATPITDNTSTGAFSTLLGQLEVEPSDPEEAQDKFKLYEDFLDTVTAMRSKTYDQWAECEGEFVDAPAVQENVRQALAGIDCTDNMSIAMDSARWFVHSMVLQASKNSDMLGSVLASIQAKLELLGKQDECPICLEPLPGQGPALSPPGEACVPRATGDGEGGADAAPDAVHVSDAVHVFGCCHCVCAPCWTHWSQLRGPTAPCPLCRHEDFLADIVEGRAIPAAEFSQLIEG